MHWAHDCIAGKRSLRRSSTMWPCQDMFHLYLCCQSSALLYGFFTKQCRRSCALGYRVFYLWQGVHIGSVKHPCVSTATKHCQIQRQKYKDKYKERVHQFNKSHSMFSPSLFFYRAIFDALSVLLFNKTRMSCVVRRPNAAQANWKYVFTDSSPGNPLYCEESECGCREENIHRKTPNRTSWDARFPSWWGGYEGGIRGLDIVRNMRME